MCLTVLPGYRFASGADEKVVRAFVAPQNFLDNFKRLCVKDSNNERGKTVFFKKCILNVILITYCLCILCTKFVKFTQICPLNEWIFTEFGMETYC